MTHPLGKIVAFAVTAVLLAGCSSGSSSSSQATTPTSGPLSTSTSDSSPTSPTSPVSSSSSVAPATGRKLDVEGFSVRTPKGFDRELGVLARNKVIVDSTTSDEISAAYITSIGPVPLSEAVRLARHNTLGGGKLKRLPDAEIAGQLFYHLTGKIDRSYIEEYGAIVDGALCFVKFNLMSTAAARRQIVASTMASFRLN